MNISAFFQEAKKEINIDSNDTYIHSYPAMVDFFSSKEILTPNDVVVGIHMVYGWMPTILTIKENDVVSIEEATDLINFFRLYNIERDGFIWDNNEVREKLELLKSKFNNSIVGVSKFLHFMRPDIYPIYDSNIYRCIYQKEPYNYRVNSIKNYCGAIKMMEEAIGFQDEAKALHLSVQEKVGYSITMVRAVEMMVFLIGKRGSVRNSVSV